MAYSCNILLGQIKKVNGYEGAVTIKLANSFIENIPQLESVFIEIDGKPVPFFISEYNYSGHDILKLKFADYNTAEMVAEFRGCKVFLTTSDNTASKDSNYEDLVGFKVIDENKTAVGNVAEIIHNPEQWLLTIISAQGKEILLPVHEDLILRIDDNKKIITVKIPDGLLEIN